MSTACGNANKHDRSVLPVEGLVAMLNDEVFDCESLIVNMTHSLVYAA
jgi:hypothetical protein